MQGMNDSRTSLENMDCNHFQVRLAAPIDFPRRLRPHQHTEIDAEAIVWYGYVPREVTGEFMKSRNRE